MYGGGDARSVLLASDFDWGEDRIAVVGTIRVIGRVAEHRRVPAHFARDRAGIGVEQQLRGITARAGTAATTTAAGTAAWRAPRATRRCSSCARVSGATSPPRCCSQKAHRCCSAATSSLAARAATTNAYCQDNEITWFDWNAAAKNTELVDFTAGLCRLREQHPVFRRRQFFNGTPAADTTRDDLDWYRPDGIPMAPQDWNASFARAVMMALSGDTGDPTRSDDPFMLMLNSWWEPLVDFTVPDPLRDLGWRVEIYTEHPDGAGREVDPSVPVTLTGRLLMLLRGTQPRTDPPTRSASPRRPRRTFAWRSCCLRSLSRLGGLEHALGGVAERADASWAPSNPSAYGVPCRNRSSSSSMLPSFSVSANTNRSPCIANE